MWRLGGNSEMEEAVQAQGSRREKPNLHRHRECYCQVLCTQLSGGPLPPSVQNCTLLRVPSWLCGNPRSHRAGLLTFEHQGCPAFEPEGVAHPLHEWDIRFK